MWGGGSDIIFLIFVFLALVGRFGSSGRLLLHHRAVALGRVTDVVPTLVHLIGSLVPVTIFVHGIKKDEDAERRGGHDADHHAGGAAGLPEDLHCSWGAPLPGAGGVSCGQIVEIGGRGYTWVFKPVKFVGFKGGGQRGVLFRVGLEGLPIVHFAGRDVADKVGRGGGGQEIGDGGRSRQSCPKVGAVSLGFFRRSFGPAN